MPRPGYCVKRDARRNKHSIEKELAWGSRAANHVRGLVHEGDRVSVELDRVPRDDAGRILGYVYLPNGDMLNARIIQEGYAAALNEPPNERYAPLFRNLFHAAKKRGLGLWR